MVAEVRRTLMIAFRYLGWTAGFILFLLILSAFITFPVYTSRNEPYQPSTLSIRASYEDWSHLRDPTNNVFVGVAISGGGSRAANFSLAIFEELERYGFLDNLSAISSVSGGSLTAAYYALFRNTPEWSWDTAREQMRTNLFRHFILKYLLPHNLLLTAFTHYDRSDVMAEVFDDVLFHGKTFRDLGPVGPKLHINATLLEGENHMQSSLSFINPGPWSFTSDAFRIYLNSDLDTYPISYAVMASGAMPGVFNNVTVQSYAPSDVTHDEIVDPISVIMQIKYGNDPISQSMRFRRELFPGAQQLLQQLLKSYVDGSVPSNELIKELGFELGILETDFVKRPQEYPMLAKDKLGMHNLSTKTNELLVSTDMTSNQDDASFPYHMNPIQEKRALLFRSLLEDFSKGIQKARPVYRHFFDGAASDNLGLESLKSAAFTFVWTPPISQKPSGCFIFSIDAYPGRAAPDPHKPDTRNVLDHLIDSNALSAIETMLGIQRHKTLDEIKDDLGEDQPTIMLKFRGDKLTCAIWHLSLFEVSGAVDSVHDYPYPKWVSEVTNAIPLIQTHYKLLGIPNCPQYVHQQLLRNAAHALIQDTHGLPKALRWFKKHGQHVNSNPPPSELPITNLPIKVHRTEVYCEQTWLENIVSWWSDE